MSICEFPPLNTEGRPYTIQEYNGRIINGTEEEFLAVNKARILSDFPSIEKTQLSGLRHCISKDNMKNVFAQGDGGVLDSAWNQLTSDGFSGVLKKVADAAEPTSLWPIARLGRGVLKVHNGMSSIAAKILPGKGTGTVEEVMEMYGSTLNWQTNWIRCLAVHPTGSRLAVCQPDDYVRVFNIGHGESRTPITLKHEKQKNVTGMEWEPHDQRVLAVAAGGTIFLWRLATKTMNIRPSGQCVKLIETNLPIITHLIWDKMSSRGLLLASPDCNKILALDTVNEEIEYFTGTWGWNSGNPTRLIPTADGKRIAILYTTNVLRVYNRLTWEFEKVTGLKGRVIDAVWSPTSECLIFATESSCYLQAIRPTNTRETSFEGNNEVKWVCSSPKPIFDFTPVEFDSTETELQGGMERPIIEIGGKVHRLVLSPDGKRLVVSFKQFSTVVATFNVEWSPEVKLEPCTLIEAPHFGTASIVSFLPKFKEGSLLSIVWSDGYAQYLPFLYSPNASMMVPTTNILDEISATSSLLGSSSRRRSLEHSLQSIDLPDGICDVSREDNEELMTERVKRTKKH